MKTYLSLLSFIVCCSFGYCVQPYFPGQIVFRVDTENGTTFSVGNYLKFTYNLVHWTNSSVDYWRSIETCLVPSLGCIHCEEMFFEKDTDIPIQYNYINIDGQHIHLQTIWFTDVTVGKSVNNYFKTIPKDYGQQNAQILILLIWLVILRC